METGKLTIELQPDNTYKMQMELIDGTIWLTDYEIARLFNVHQSSINNHIRAIFKNGLLHEDEVTQTYAYTRNKKQYETTLYNLDLILFVSYRIRSYEAETFREYIRSALIETCGNKPKNMEIYVVSSLHNRQDRMMN